MKQLINYANLIINPENYRFDPVETQEQAIDLMITKKGTEILNMAKHISEHGLDTSKDIRVLELENNKFLILDGNRRVVSVKCLHEPGLVKDQKIKEGFLKIVNTGCEVISDIPCFIYKDEESAAKWINLDHTGKNDGVGQDPWGTPEKERFGYKFDGKLSPAMQCIGIIEEELNKKINTEKIKISTINRILSNPDARSYIGIKTNNGKISFTCDKKEAVNRLDKLFNKFSEEDIPVRNVYKSDQILDFAEKLYKDKPKTCKNQTLPLPNPQGVVASKVINTEKRTLAKKEWITFDEYREYNGHYRVKKMMNEMRSLEPKENANILMPALRVVLELAVYHALEEKKHIVKIVNEYKTRLKSENIKRVEKGVALLELKKQWAPGLKEMLNYMANEEKAVISDPQAVKALEKKVKKEENFVTDLNSFVHNVHDIPGKNDPERIWSGFGRLIFSVIKKIE